MVWAHKYGGCRGEERPARGRELPAGDAEVRGEGVNEAMGSLSVATGVYREIVLNERVSFTWNGNWEPEEESLVTVTLKDLPDGAFGTEVTIKHERFLTTASMSGHEQGWVGSLTKLACLLEG